jgi:hypothetical protein
MAAGITGADGSTRRTEITREPLYPGNKPPTVRLWSEMAAGRPIPPLMDSAQPLAQPASRRHGLAQRLLTRGGHALQGGAQRARW